MKIPTTGNKGQDALIFIVALLVAYQVYKILRGIADRVTESGKIDKGADVARNSKYFNPKFWDDTLPYIKKAFGSIEPNAGAGLLFGKSVNWYVKASKEIYDAKSGVRIGTFGIGSGDNEEAVISLFKNTNSQLEISLLCWAFNIEFKRDLFGYLDTFMKNRTIVTLKDIAESKPLYPAALVSQAKKQNFKLPA